MGRPIWNSQGLSPNETAIDAYGNPILSEEERRRIAAKKQRDKLLSGIMGFGKQVYQSNPLLKAVGDPIRDVYRNYDAELQNGVPQIVRSAQHPLTIEINKMLGPKPRQFDPSDGMGVNTNIKKTSPFSPGMLEAMRSGGAKHHAGMGIPEEEDEFMSYDDQMFLLALMEGMQGGKPHTPYGTAVGGGNKSWASLPFPGMA